MTTGGNPTTGFSGLAFTLSKVVMTPDIAAVDQEVKITGSISLFGIPFLGLAWVIADITWPKKGLDLTNPISHNETMAFGGHFTIGIPQGFDREGQFSVQILAFLGPTIKEAFGVGGVTTIPPLPNIAAWPVFNYTVSGVLTNDISIGFPTVPPKVYAGGAVDVVIPITNNTASDQAIKVTMQDKQQDKFLFVSWNGALVDTLSDSLTIPTGKTYTIGFTYVETSDLGSRNLIIKATAISNGAVLGSGEFDGIYSVVAPVALSITISPSIIKVGGLLSFVVNGFGANELVKLTNQGDSTVLYSFTTDSTGYYAGGFDFLGNPGIYTLVATGANGDNTSADYTVQAAQSQYTVTINPNTINYHGTANITISGFPANTSVSFAVVTQQYPTPGNSVITIHTDASGSGSGSLGTTSSAGTYYLVDVNGYGTSTMFQIIGGFPTAPTLSLANDNVVQGGLVNFDLFNFTPNSVVVVSEPNGNKVSILTDSAGDNVGVLSNTEPQGSYTITAIDPAGLQATATLNVVGQNTISFKVYLYGADELVVFSNTIGLKPLLMHIVPIPTYYPVTSWTCKYYDPVSQSTINGGSTTPTSGISFTNVHPGGHLITTFTSSNSTTPEIDSSDFTAQNGDVWSFNPYNAVNGIGSDMLKSNGGGNPPQYAVSISVNPLNSGTVSVDKDTPYYDGDVVTLTAVPASGYSFLNFLINDIFYADNPHITTIIQNTTIVANFKIGGGGATPQFPAPTGDTSWWWLVFNDGSSGWFNQNDYQGLIQVGTTFWAVYGPFAPGATS